MSARIGIVDYGMGNRRSVEKALERVGAEAVISADVELLRGCDGLVLPGVGAFPRAMANLRERALDVLMAEQREAGVPLLGLCLGLQLLFDESVELGGAEGLGFLPGQVVEVVAPPGGKLPHIGWNLVSFTRSSELTEGLPEATPFYHVHSFAVAPAEPGDIVGTSEYGEVFVSVVARPPLYGAQFHPEKSSVHGLALLRNFTEICETKSLGRTPKRRSQTAGPDAPRSTPIA